MFIGIDLLLCIRFGDTEMHNRRLAGEIDFNMDRSKIYRRNISEISIYKSGI